MTVRAVGSAELPNERCEFRLQLTCPWHQPRAVRRLVSGDDPIRAYLAGGRLARDGHRSGAPPKSGSQKTRRWREKDSNPRSPVRKNRRFKFAQQMAARKAHLLRGHNDQFLDPARLSRETAPMRPTSSGHCTKKLLEIWTTPSSVPARKSWRCAEKQRDTVRP